jgi:aminoglycoside N3'-acetyltransferase
MSIRTMIRDAGRHLLHTKDLTSELRRRRLSLKKRIYRRSFSLADTRELFSQLGIERGRVIWMQSSWDEFYNLTAKPNEVLSLILDMLGPTGTLAMPAFPLVQDPARVLDIDYAPSSTGLLTEIFRRQRGVRRSIHLTSSVCALGPAAEFLVQDHHRDVFAWGLKTPYCRLKEVDARAVCLGLGGFVMNLTPLHAVECLLYDEVPYFRQVFSGMISYQWRRASGETGSHEYRQRIGRIRMRGFGRHFPRESYTERRVSNLETFAIDVRTAIDHAVALGRRGITMYVDPKPRRTLFMNPGVLSDH